MDDPDDYAEDEDYAYPEEPETAPMRRDRTPVVPVSDTDTGMVPEQGLSTHGLGTTASSLHLSQSCPEGHTEAGLSELHAAIAGQLDLLAANAAATHDAIQQYRVSAQRIADMRANEIFVQGSRAASEQSACFAQSIATFASELVSEVDRVEAVKRAALEAELLGLDETLEAFTAIKENEGAPTSPSAAGSAALQTFLDGLWRSIPFFPLEPRRRRCRKRAIRL